MATSVRCAEVGSVVASYPLLLTEHFGLIFVVA